MLLTESLVSAARQQFRKGGEMGAIYRLDVIHPVPLSLNLKAKVVVEKNYVLSSFPNHISGKV